MPDITNPLAVRFANERSRTIADIIETMDRTCQQFMIEVLDFEAATSGHADTDVIADGSATDGRTTVTKLDVLALKYVVEQVLAAMATDDRRQVVGKWSVNGRPLY
jgi:hypothetical protein